MPGAGAIHPVKRTRLRAGGRWIRTSRSAVDWQKFVVSSELGPIYRCTVIRAVAGLGEHRVVGRGPGAPPLTARIRRRHTKVALSAVRAHRGSKGSIRPLQQRVSSLAAGPEEPYASVLDRSLKRRRLRRGHQWQLVYDRPEAGVGFGLKAAVPSRRDEIVDRVIAGIAQGPHQGFRLVEMAHPVVTTMHDMNGDVPQSGNMVENIVVIAIRRAAGAKESAIDHVVNEDPGGG